MAWSYRRRIKIIPGVHLNFSKSGISTSIGVRGASMTFGKNGAYVNTGIPGTGFYNRQKLSSDNSNSNSNFIPQAIQTVEPADNIFSADIQAITSQDMLGIKEAIIAAHEQRKELRNDLLKIKTSLTFSRLKLIASYIFIIGVVNKSLATGIKGIEDIKSKFEVLWFKNANGADIYFYPTFIVMYSSQKSFAIVGFNELQLSHLPVRFVETGSIPSDTKIIDRTWAKVNKNGSPDKRFKGNYQIPVVRYGQINLRTETGMNEEYEFSNYEFSEQFSSAFLDFQNTVKGLKLTSGQYFEQE